MKEGRGVPRARSAFRADGRRYEDPISSNPHVMDTSAESPQWERSRAPAPASWDYHDGRGFLHSGGSNSAGYVDGISPSSYGSRERIARAEAADTHHDISSGDSADMQRTYDICSGYLRGQLANVAKAAVWWSTFGVVAEALTKVPLAVGATRLVFNMALVMLSPLAGAVAEKCNMRTLLNLTTGGRLFIWCGFIPGCWLYFVAHLNRNFLFFIFFLILMFLDGIQVSFANVVDIDCGGLDTLAHQYKLSIGNYLRDRFNRIHQVVFDLSFVLVTPPLAALIWYIAMRVDQRNLHLQHFGTSMWQAVTINDENRDVLVLMIGICLIFGILSSYSLWSYWRALSPHNIMSSISSFGTRASEGSARTMTNMESSERTSDWSSTVERFKDVKDGLLIVMAEKPLGWRLCFLAMETAFEDSIVSVVIPQVALQMTPLIWSRFTKKLSINPGTSNYHLPPRLPGGWALVNLVAVCLIAIGKSGGFASGSYTSARWIAPATIDLHGPYRKLFRYVFLSSLSLLAFPFGYWLLCDSTLITLFVGNEMPAGTIQQIQAIVATVLMALAAFLFFVFSTAPKIGFATLLQCLVVQRNVDPKVFGFVGTFVTLADAVVILGINSIFAYCGLDHFLLALMIGCTIYLLHGLAELLLGPRLILAPAAASLGNSGFDGDVGDFPNLFRYPEVTSSPMAGAPEAYTNAVVHPSQKSRGKMSEGAKEDSRTLAPSAGWDTHRHQLEALEPMVRDAPERRVDGSWAQ